MTSSYRQSDTELDGLVRDFVARVQSLPQVREVRVVVDSDGCAAWTVIAAPPFDRAHRDPVYAAELAVLDARTESAAAFRVLNRAEYDADTLAHVLPADSRVLLDFTLSTIHIPAL